MTNLAAITSVAALGLATLTLVLVIATRRASRVVVTAIIYQTDDLAWRLRLDVNNPSVAAINVRAVWLWLSKRQPSHPHTPGFLGTRQGRPLTLTNPDLPTKVDSRDWRTWEIALPHTDEISATSPKNTRAYVAVYLSLGRMVSVPVTMAGDTIKP